MPRQCVRNKRSPDDPFFNEPGATHADVPKGKVVLLSPVDRRFPSLGPGALNFPAAQCHDNLPGTNDNRMIILNEAEATHADALPLKRTALSKKVRRR